MSEKTSRPRHLGKGLEALLGGAVGPGISSAQGNVGSVVPLSPTSVNAAESADENADTRKDYYFEEIDIALVSPNPYQVRHTWNEKELEELSQSIIENGIIQPVIVKALEAGYQLIAGERRYRAAKMAGLEKIPAIVRAVSDSQMMEVAIIENIHRSNLNPVERALAYRDYMSRFSMTQAQMGEKLGQDRSVIANYLRLLDLPTEIKDMLADGRLSMGHARAILSLESDELRRKIANRALAGRLSVREVERLVRLYLTDSEQAVAKKKIKSPHILELEDRLKMHLGTKVAIDTKKNGQKGKITIEFNSLDEFDRITERLGLTNIEEL